MNGSRWRDWAGFLLLLAVLLPVKLWRMSLESSIWVDETYSYLLSTFPFARLIDLATVDSHPPIHYLLAKGWYRLGGVLWGAPGILWGRGMNLIPWAGMAAAVWFGGRALLGRSGGTLLAWAVMGCAQTADVTQWFRSYALVCPALFVCFMILVVTGPGDFLGLVVLSPARRRVLWGLYAICGSLALWGHPLSVFLLLVYGLIWAGLVAGRRAWRSGFALGGLAAQAVIVLGFLPWVPRIGRQYEYFHTTGSTWIPKPTLDLLGKVFVYWYPFGQIRSGPPSLLHPHVFLGAASLLLPIAVAVLGARKPRASDTSDPRCPAALWIGVLGCGASLVFLVLTWGIHRLNLAHTFFGPRYASVAAAPWAAGQAAFAWYGIRRLGGRAGYAWLLLVPWFLCTVIGQSRQLRSERDTGLQKWLARFTEDLLNPRAPLYVMPSSLIPLYHGTLGRFDVRPVEALGDLDTSGTAVVVLGLNLWRVLDTPAMRVADTVLRERRFCDRVYQFNDTTPFTGYHLFYLPGFDPGRGREILRRRFAPTPLSVPPTAVAAATAEQQFQFDGWNELEIDDQFRAFRWGASSRSVVRFDRPVRPGSYTLHFFGYRQPYPRDPEVMSFRFGGEATVYGVSQPQGPMILQLPVRLERAHSPLRFEVRHPAWRPKDCQKDSDDPRRLSILFSYAYLEAL